MARRAAKVDQTHGTIRDALRKAGISVFDTSAVHFGFPDFVCAYRGYTCLVEAKTGKRGLRDTQREFIGKWPGKVIVTSSPEEAVKQFFESYAVSVLNRV